MTIFIYLPKVEGRKVLPKAAHHHTIMYTYGRILTIDNIEHWTVLVCSKYVFIFFAGGFSVKRSASKIVDPLRYFFGLFGLCFHLLSFSLSFYVYCFSPTSGKLPHSHHKLKWKIIAMNKCDLREPIYVLLKTWLVLIGPGGGKW